MTNRKSRIQQTREAEPVHEEYEYDFEQKGILNTDKIPAREGYSQRWVRTKIKGEDDQTNVFKRINEGWTVRPIDSVPEGLKAVAPRVDLNGSQVIGIHGNVLMEMPTKKLEAKKRYVRKATENQSEAVRQNMFNVHKDGSGMSRPTMQNKSSVSKGRVPEVADD